MPDTHQSTQFEEILIPPALLAGLYSQSLVVIEKGSKKSATKAFTGAGPDTFQLPAEAAPLVLPQAAETEKTASYPSSLSSLGNFSKSVLVLVSDPMSLHLGDEELDTLGKMLQALALSLADIAIVNTAHQKVNWTAIQNQFPAKQVIMFGVEPSEIQIPVRFPHYRVQQWNNMSFLFSPSLTDINRPSAEQKQMKMALWTAIKELFGR